MFGILIIFLIIISNINHPVNYQINANSYIENNKVGYIDGLRFTYSEKDSYTYVTLDNSITKKNKYSLVKFMCDVINNIKGYNKISKIKYSSVKRKQLKRSIGLECWQKQMKISKKNVRFYGKKPRS